MEKSSRNRNIAEGKSCNRIKTAMESCKDFARKLEVNYYKDFRKLEKSTAASWTKFVQICQKSCALRKYNFRTMRRKSLCRCTENDSWQGEKIVQMCREIRSIFVQMYRKTSKNVEFQ